MSILVIDVGTSGVRAGIVHSDSTVTDVAYREVLPDTPFPGLVEFEAGALAGAALDVATQALAAHGTPVEAVGIANQRASTVVWDRTSGVPVGPGIGWQDLRTIGECLTLQGQGIRLTPNASATKLAHLLDAHDPDRSRDLCFGTIDTWLAWTLTGGAAGGVHVTDPTNAATTGLTTRDGLTWSQHHLDALRIPAGVLPKIVDSSGRIAACTALPGAPVLAGIAGDQQASLIGQACVHPGHAKATFGTGGMLDAITGGRAEFDARGTGGCFPIVARSKDGAAVWGVEAMMLSAGTCIEWLRDDLGLIASAAESGELAATCESTGGLAFVPAMLGLGTPHWDFGARGTLLGLTRGSGRAEITRAVLEGIAHRGADLLEAAEVDGTGSDGATLHVAALRVDGGMSANTVFVQALADACGRPIEVSRQLEATTLGAGYLAGLAIGTWGSVDDVAAAWSPARVIEPSSNGPALSRERWIDAVGRASRWEPDLSSLEF